MGREHDSLIGQKLGIYQVQSKLGEGGMAQVYKAYHPRLRREVAIKVILSEIAHSVGFQERFEREAQMIASLEHPNIVSVYDFGEEGNLTYLVMQYVGGGTLREQLRGKQPLESQRAVRYTIQMALALHHAHQRGIVHRDVKPQNMLISSADPDHLLLSDFGIAKLYYQSGEEFVATEMPTHANSNSALTSASQIIGTADYMSPEQASGSAVDARTDVYALGIVLYQMLVGDIPFHSTTFQGLLFQQLYTPPPPILARNRQVPEILAQITAKALAKAPADRFPTAEAMARALEQANLHATMLNSFTAGYPPGSPNPAYQAYPPATPGASTLRAPSMPPAMNPPMSSPMSPPTGVDQYATLSAPQTAPQGWARTEPMASGQNMPRPRTGSVITSPPQARPVTRRFALSSILLALVVIASLVVLGLRFLPGLSSNSTNPTTGSTNNGSAQAFHELFQDNHLNWPAGNLSAGVTTSTPAGGAYITSISTKNTAFPYPQAVGLLPDNFTLSATLIQTAGALNDSFGLAFHFAEDSSGHVTCYALVIISNGVYAIYQYTGNNANSPTQITGGIFQASKQQHTLAVKAQGSNYSFFIDSQPLSFAVGAQAASTSWNNSDLHGGRLALFFAGPNNPGDPTASFKASSVDLSTP
ncbi:MAG TPA: protein kinase [Ktedonobacteraceae bacterium]